MDADDGKNELSAACKDLSAAAKWRQLPDATDSAARSKDQLLRLIATTGFACVDACLYLDTHPEDSEAIAYFREMNLKYQEALHEYSQKYGPLNLSHVHHPTDYWKWVDQPWPWQ